jgi:hypothetical protein
MYCGRTSSENNAAGKERERHRGVAKYKNALSVGAFEKTTFGQASEGAIKCKKRRNSAEIQLRGERLSDMLKM